MRRIEVQAYDPGWPARALEESERLRTALGGDEEVAVHHIGSTAVPGLAAKPTIDLVVEVADLARLDAARAQLEAAGYLWRGENGIAGRRYLTRSGPDGARLAHVHCFRAGHEAIAEHLAFRDYLRAHPEVARRYAALKLACAAAHPDDGAAYSASKAPFVESVQSDAQRWRASVTALR